MIRTYCDKCGNEITADNYFSYQKLNIVGGLDIEISASPHSKFQVAPPDADPPGYVPKQTVDICRHCVIDAVSRLDDRPAAGGISPAYRMLDEKALVNIAKRHGGSANSARGAIQTFCVVRNIALADLEQES